VALFMAPLASIFSISAVQLTFSFEIAAMQLTPTFKMGVLQVRPTSKIVTMRLPPSQHLQSAMNFQVNFEVAKIQPGGGAVGDISVMQLNLVSHGPKRA